MTSSSRWCFDRHLVTGVIVAVALVAVDSQSSDRPVRPRTIVTTDPGEVPGCLSPQRPVRLSSNGHLFVEFDWTTGLTTSPRPLCEFPTPAELRARYERIMGFSLEAPVAKPLLARYPEGE
jgi:hypothetical protein